MSAVKPGRPLVCIAGLVLGIVAVAIVGQDPDAALGGDSAGAIVALLGAGWALVGCGVAAWTLHPESSFGPLLAAAGCAWFLVQLANPGSSSSLAFTVGLVTYAVVPAVVAHAALTYGSGRLSSAAERGAVAVAYAGSLLVLGILPALVFHPASQGCSQCPANLAAVTSDPVLFSDLNRAGVWLGAGWSVLLAALVGWRIARSSPTARLVSGPVLLAAVAYLVLVASGYVHSLDRGFLSNDPVDQGLWFGQAVALAALALAVLGAWARGWRARTAVARLVVALGDEPPPGGLRDVLARALDDPGLELAYPLGEGVCVDAQGRPATLTSGEDRDRTTLLRDGRPVAILALRTDLRDDPGLVSDVGAAARLALDHERLRAQALAQLAQLRASRSRTVAAADAERRRLERDLHDGAQQRLVVLALALRLLRAQLDDGAAARIDAADAELQRALAELRALAHGVFPAVLTDEGLVAALEALRETAAVPLLVDVAHDERLAPAVEAAAYFLVAEVVDSATTTTVAVRTSSSRGRLRVEIDSAAPLHCDLVDVEDRIGALDGALVVERIPAGGTAIRAEVPCGS